MIKVNYNNVIYVINKDDSTSSIINGHKSTGDIIIPRSINYESKEYIVSRILRGSFQNSQIKSISFSPDSELLIIEKEAFRSSRIESITIPRHLTQICRYSFEYCNYLKTIEIPENSELQTIEEYAFTCSAIESFTIPASLIELKEGFCTGKSKLTQIIVNQNNPIYELYQNKLIVGKMNPEIEDFGGVVLFARRDIETAFIPSSIKRIGAFAFNLCDKLLNIEIQDDSQLQTIGKFSFCGSSIKSIKIPPSVTCIETSAFNSCMKLQKIDISSDSRLRLIGEEAFRFTGISSIFIPKYVEQIGDKSFEYCLALEIIEFDENSQIEKISPTLFNDNSSVLIMIPFKVSCRLNL